MFLLSPNIFWWDLAILLLLAGSLSVILLSWRFLRRPRNGRIARGIAWIAHIGCIILFVTVGYGSFIEPHILITREFAVRLPVSQSLKIAVISDLHVGPYKGRSWVARVVQQVNAQLPDIVLIPGDFLFDASADVTDLEPLRDLRAPLGVFAVDGNHDSGHYLHLNGQPYGADDRRSDLNAYLTGLGVNVLENTHRILPLLNGSVAIAGVKDIWSKDSDLAATLRGIPETVPTILVSHHPDVIIDPHSQAAGLIVAGHTHGGQFRLPFYGPIPHLPTMLGQAYDQGTFALDSTHTLAITRGVGETLARARLFAWPEVMVLRIEGNSAQ